MSAKLRETSADPIVARSLTVALVQAGLAVTLLTDDGTDRPRVVAVVQDADEPIAGSQELNKIK